MIADDFDENTKMLITNAIYFNGKFVNPFKKDATEKNTAFFSDNKRKTEICKVSMMKTEKTRGCYARKVHGVYDLVKL